MQNKKKGLKTCHCCYSIEWNSFNVKRYFDFCHDNHLLLDKIESRSKINVKLNLEKFSL
jgi:hypothetical protein